MRHIVQIHFGLSAVEEMSTKFMCIEFLTVATFWYAAHSIFSVVSFAAQNLKNLSTYKISLAWHLLSQRDAELLCVWVYRLDQM